MYDFEETGPEGLPGSRPNVQVSQCQALAALGRGEFESREYLRYGKGGREAALAAAKSRVAAAEAARKAAEEEAAVARAERAGLTLTIPVLATIAI